MKIANISYTKNHLSALLEQVQTGESILIVDRQRPVARIEPVEKTTATDAWVADLERRGVLTSPRRAPNMGKIMARKLPRPAKGADVVQALLADREEGR